MSQLFKDSIELNKYFAEEHFDCFMVGSDQVWRPRYSPCITDYFLKEIPVNTKALKIAYAASFGTSNWEFSEEDTLECARLAKLFDKISVREKSGIRLCQENLGIQAQYVLDPTLMLDAGDYIRFYSITEEEFEAGWRLSCNCKVLSDCVVFVPDIASAYQSRMKTADLSSPKEIAIFEECQNSLHSRGIAFENPYRAVVVEMAEPTLDDTMPDNERLTWAVQEALGVEKVNIPFCVMVKLAHTLREHNWTVCVKGEIQGETFQCMEICDPAESITISSMTSSSTGILCRTFSRRTVAVGALRSESLSSVFFDLIS